MEAFEGEDEEMKTLRPEFRVFYQDKRIIKDDWLLLLAWTVSLRATCPRRAVGCVLADAGGHVLSTGYNGTVTGTPHCLVSPCAGKPPNDVSCCEAVHAEENALLQLRDHRALHTAYITCSPCPGCVKLLRNAGCQRVVFGAIHKTAEQARALWFSTFGDDSNARILSSWDARLGVFPEERDPGDPSAFGGQ